MDYTYWVLRHVPDAVRGEFINIGVVVGQFDGDDWALRRLSNLGQANRLGGDARRSQNWLLRLQAMIDPDSLPLGQLVAFEVGAERRLSAGWMERARRQQRNNIQISEPSPVRASNAAQAADELFTTLVAPANARSIYPRGRSEAVRDLREALLTRLPNADVHRDVKLNVGLQTARFDFAVGRGGISQLSHVVSFQVKNTERVHQALQASSYAVKRLRESGGELINPHRRRNNYFALRPETPLRVLYIPPKTAPQIEVWKSAAEAWTHLGVRSYQFGEEDQIAEEAEQLLWSA